jgi:hypothetical protein
VHAATTVWPLRLGSVFGRILGPSQERLRRQKHRLVWNPCRDEWLPSYRVIRLWVRLFGSLRDKVTSLSSATDALRGQP